MELLSGADMIARALHDEGVEYIYGYPGGAALHIYDALFRQDNVQHILVRHEQAATHAADGYARASGKPGVVLVTSGPGATNAVTGIATAYMDSIPMVVLCGQVASHLIGEDAFQETDIVGVTRPIVKHSFSIKHPSEIPEVIKKAFYLASSGRPGPVVIDIPKDMTAPTERYEYSYPKKVRMRSYSPVTRGHSGQIKKAVELMLKARRPLFFTGGGVVSGRASEALTDLVRRLKAQRPELEIILNGGLETLEQGLAETVPLDGMMLGRAAYHTPWILAEADSRLFGKADPVASRVEAVDAYRPYLESQLGKGTRLHDMTRHMLGLFTGQPGARLWRRILSEKAPKRGAGLEVIDEALAAVVPRDEAA